jgi:N-acetylneuraminate synthase
MRHTKIVAEVSSNHNQDLNRSLEFVDIAADCGFDAIKFQLFEVEKLFSPEARIKNPQLGKRKGWELPPSFIAPLASRAHDLGMEFSCTPFHLEAVEFLEPFVDFYKIASYELLWPDLAQACAKTGKPLVISTGMADLSEVELAVSAICENFPETNLTILHAVSSYPAPFAECNLAAIETLRQRFGFLVGWSDHTVSDGVINAAVFGQSASMIEMHIDLDGKGFEFESQHCWLPKKAKKLISNIREGEKSIGDGIKQPVPAEIPDRIWRADPHDGLRPFMSKRAELNQT